MKSNPRGGYNNIIERLSRTDERNHQTHIIVQYYTELINHFTQYTLV